MFFQLGVYSSSYFVWNMDISFKRNCLELMEVGFTSIFTVIFTTQCQVLHHLQKFCEILGYPDMEDVKGTQNSIQYFKSKINAQDFEGKTPYLEEMCRKFTDSESDLLKKMLTWNPESRITTKQALSHEYFQGCEYLENNWNPPQNISPTISEFDLSTDDRATFKNSFIEEILSFRLSEKK